MDSVEQFKHLLDRLTPEETQRMTHREVESLVQLEGVELLRRMTQGYFDQRNSEEPIRERVVGEDGIARTHPREGSKSRLETRFGEMTVTRRGYGARGLDGVFPLDAELSLPPDKYSHGLREAVVEEVIRGLFDEAVGHLERSGGGRMAKHQAEEVAVRRDPDQRMRGVVLVDGHDDLLRQVYAAAKRYKVEITVVQDFIHVLEYLWKVAHALHPEAGEERESWIKDCSEALLRGRAQDVAVGLRRAATCKQLDQRERKPVDKTANYIENNQQRLCYDQALAQGLPIATGVIEGACRHLVKDRMDITRARSGLDRSEAILKLRSPKVSGDLDSYLEFHFKQEQKRNYPGPPIPEVEAKAA